MSAFEEEITTCEEESCILASDQSKAKACTHSPLDSADKVM